MAKISSAEYRIAIEKRDRRIANLEAALRRINTVLAVEAAEYVPAIREAWDVVDMALRTGDGVFAAHEREKNARIEELERDRERLCAVIAADAPRKALVALVARFDAMPKQICWPEIEAARKALADTECR